MSTQVENYWLAAALVLCTHACVLCARAGGVTLLGVIVNCTVYLCRWRDVTCRHLYYVLELVYYVLVQVKWCYMSSSVLCTRAGVLCAGAGGEMLRVVICIMYSSWCIMCWCRWSDVTCRHLYYVLELVYYVPVQVEWRCYVRQPRTTVEWLLSVIRLTMTGACCLLVDWTVCLAHNICQLLYLSLMNLDLIFTIVVKQHAGNLTAVCVVSVFVYICSFHH